MSKYKVKQDVILNILDASVKCKEGDIIELDKKHAEDHKAYVEKVVRRGRPKKEEISIEIEIDEE